ncbi:MAG TPA: PDZ domain-containing protein [Fimbriimonadaceae bacterium]|nr:PDZ domain-containing protein [Fimbriimonadaceae bacterium]
MKRASKNWFGAVAVLAVVGALAGGNLLRERIEVGRPLQTASSREGGSLTDGTPRALLYASTDKNPQVPETEYFYRLSELLKERYVDPVKDDEQLAEGAVRGMVLSLDDPYSEFMNPEQFKAYQRRVRGEFEGIGIEVKLFYDAQQREALAKLRKERSTEVQEETPAVTPGELIPSVIVTAVAPGSPAAKAGLQPGDRIDKIDERWVYSAPIFRTFQEAQRKLRRGELDSAELSKLRKALSEKSKHGLTPARARDKVLMGTNGTVKVAWEREGQVQEATMEKALTKVAPVSPSGDALAVKFFVGVKDPLRSAIEGKSQVTLDLRNGTLGDFDSMKSALEVVLPAGTYGRFSAERAGRPRELILKEGASSTPKIKLRVDETTRGAGEIFARVLVGAGKATLDGKLPGEAVRLEGVSLPSGAGYVLPVATYEVSR